MADFHVRFTSRHANCLKFEEKDRAAVRLKSLLRLISGMRLVSGLDCINPRSQLYYFNGDYRTQVSSSPEISLELLLDELSNPFDIRALRELTPRDFSTEPNNDLDFIQLLLDEPMARENILLVTLAHENALNLLVNTYKIYENIKVDLVI